LGVLSLIPLKDKPAYTNINSKWFKFITDNKDLISKYIKKSNPMEEEVPVRSEIEELF
jgi:predicted Rossmann fold nucleotide-binding protein DprA/Smf involved in DNA uptake